MLDEALPNLKLIYLIYLYNKYHLAQFHGRFERYHQQHNLSQVQQNFHYYYNIKNSPLFHLQKTNGSKLWLRNNLSTMTSQLIDTFIYQFTWVFATGMDWSTALALALTKYVFKVIIAAVDTIFIYWVKRW